MAFSCQKILSREKIVLVLILVLIHMSEGRVDRNFSARHGLKWLQKGQVSPSRKTLTKTCIPWFCLSRVPTERMLSQAGGRCLSKEGRAESTPGVL